MIPWAAENPDSYRRTRVLVVGPSGAGKSTLCHLISQGKAPDVPYKGTTVGCNAFVKMLRVDNEGRRLPTPPSSASSNAAKPLPPDPQTTAFVELIDIGGHPRYAHLREVYYGNIHGVILVYDMTNSRYKSVVTRWASEVATRASLTATLPPELAQANLEGLPVPVLLVGNKADKVGEDQGGHKKSSGYSLSTTLANLLGPTVWSYVQKVVELEENFRAKIAGRSLLPLHTSSHHHSHTSSSASLTPHHHNHSSSFGFLNNHSNTSPAVTAGTAVSVDMSPQGLLHAGGASHARPTSLAASLRAGEAGPSVSGVVKGCALKGQVDMEAIDEFLASVVARRFNSATMQQSSLSGGLFGITKDLFGSQPQPLTRRRESPNASSTIFGSPSHHHAAMTGNAAGGNALHSSGGHFSLSMSTASGGGTHAAQPPLGAATQAGAPKSYASARLDDDIDFA